MIRETAKEKRKARRPLEGIRVLDLTRVLAGPYCALLLSDLGAEIIKVEAPEGDPSRNAPPSYKGDSVHFLSRNRGRKSVTLNLREGEGKELFQELVACSDVVLENYRPGVMERMGLGYQALRAIKPDIVMTSITGYGQYGPYKDYAAHNTSVVSFSGVYYMTGYPDRPPVQPVGGLADCSAAVYAALGTAAALFRRNLTGEGQHVDISMLDGVLGFISWHLTNYLLRGEEATREGHGHSHRALHTIFEAKDGWVYVQADLDSEWTRLVKTMGRKEMLEDPRFKTQTLRAENRELINQAVQEWVQERTKKEATEILFKAGVPCSPINTIPDVAHDPHVKAREMLVEVEHPSAGKIPLIGSPVKLEGITRPQPIPPPLLGEHNQEVYCGLLGYSQERLKELKERGIL